MIMLVEMVKKTEIYRVLIMSVQFCGTSFCITFLIQFSNKFHQVPSNLFILVGLPVHQSILMFCLVILAPYPMSLKLL